MEKISIACKNSNKTFDVKKGTSLAELATMAGIKYITDEKTGETFPILAAVVDHKLKELSYNLLLSHEVEFIGYPHSNGKRTYNRSICFMLQYVVRKLYPDKILVIDHSLPTGIYCEIRETKTDERGLPEVFRTDSGCLEKIYREMKETVKADLPFIKTKITSKDAVALYKKQNQPRKAEFLMSQGDYFTSIYRLGEVMDNFYGPLVPSTGYLTSFHLSRFSKGFCLHIPYLMEERHDISPCYKIASALEEYSAWCNIVGISGIGSLNKNIFEGNATKIINLSEALQERKYVEIANMIFNKKDTVRIVFMAGPSSSGKTSSSLRIACQCRVLGLNPKVIELDNYFVNRKKTPRDENGDYDFEALNALDLEFLNAQLNDLIAGKEVEIPKFNFKTGERTFEGNKIKLRENDILIMEGIHALNPEMVANVDPEKVFRVYVSALTSLNIDENNYISSSDNRLLRRMVRDNRVRGISPEETILRWHSVRRGESKNIFPYQENADAIFNSALVYELPLLKYYAEPLLRRISPMSPAYTEAVRLLKFLGYVAELQPSEIATIPPTSIMREFIGGQTL